MTRDEKAAVRKEFMRIWAEASDLPIDQYKFTPGLRGNLKIIIGNAMQTLGLGPPWATHYAREDGNRKRKRKRCGCCRSLVFDLTRHIREVSCGP